MVYVAEVSKAEANCILMAYHRHKKYLDYDTELCSHLQEEDFLYKHNTLILNYRDIPFFGKVVKLIHESITDIAANEIFSKRIISEFQDALKTSRFAQTLLWCHRLLVNCHKREECSEYMSLALKLKLLAYWKIKYGYIESPTTDIETVTEFLNYISFFNCKEKVFTSCLGVFFNDYDFYGLEDFLEPVLPTVFYVAHKLRFNVFKTWDSEFKLDFQVYAQKSFVQNAKRFLTLAKYGYEDIRFKADVDYNLFYLSMRNSQSLFGFESYWNGNKCFAKMYRSLQVIVLYVQATFEKTEHSQDVFDKVLYFLWETIADPYLTQGHFMFFEKSDKFPEYLKVWKWYSKIVLKDRIPECSPRSLKHLTRCSIRRTLTACAQFPFAVEGLGIPLMLKNYLRFE